MSVMTGVLPHGRPVTVDDLDGMPDDGNRYEPGVLFAPVDVQPDHRPGWCARYEFPTTGTIGSSDPSVPHLTEEGP